MQQLCGMYGSFRFQTQLQKSSSQVKGEDVWQVHNNTWFIIPTCFVISIYLAFAGILIHLAFEGRAWWCRSYGWSIDRWRGKKETAFFQTLIFLFPFFTL